MGVCIRTYTIWKTFLNSFIQKVGYTYVLHLVLLCREEDNESLPCVNNPFVCYKYSEASPM
jgi:hypothetical protein